MVDAVMTRCALSFTENFCKRYRDTNIKDDINCLVVDADMNTLLFSHDIQ